MAERLSVLEEAVRLVEVPMREIVEAPMGEDEVGMVKGVGLETKEPRRGVLLTGKDEELWLVELPVMKAVTGANVETEKTALRKCPRGCSEGEKEQAQGHDAHAVQDDLTHVWSPPPFSQKS